MASEWTIGDTGSGSFVSLMHEKLPEYVVNCMRTSGFDVPEVVSSMDVTDKPGNSIEQIEHFIGENFADQEEYKNTYFQSSSARLPMGGRFVFPPGHRIRISNFVSHVKNQLDASVKAPKNTKSIEKAKAIRVRSSTKSDSDTDTESIANISKHVRKNIASWMEKQGSKNL